MLQLSSRSVVTSLSGAEFERFRCDWRKNHLVVLPQFFDTALLELVRAHVRGAEFFDNRHPASGRETTMKKDRIIWQLDFLMNTAALLQQIEAITGCGPLRYFQGRVYQLTPGTDQGHDWHDDFAHHRRLGVSVNLSERVFAGGVLQLRDDRTKATLAEISNTGAGDCVIFRLGDDIEHRVLPVTGAVARQAYAGWFHDGPTQLDRLAAAQ
jgi:hypothetical protein